MIDTHCHIDFPEYDKDRDQVIKRAKNTLDAVVLSGTNYEANIGALKYAKEEKGFFSKMFSSSTADTGPVKYRIAVRKTDSVTEVSVQNAAGKAENSPVAQRILKLLADDLR